MTLGSTKANEQYAYFSLHGDFDPTAISQAVGVTGTNYWVKGDRTPNGQHVRAFSRWTLESSLAKTEPLEDHIRNVLAQLDCNPVEFRKLSLQHHGTMQLVGYFWAEYPGLHFEPDLVEGIARYQLAIDFDFYGLYSHRREDIGFTFQG